MKHKNLLKLMAVVMILAMAMTMLIACGPKEEDTDTEDDKPTFTAQNAADEIANAIVNSLGAVKAGEAKPIGFQYGLIIPTDVESKINIAGYLDTAKDGAANTRVYLDYSEDEVRKFSLSADKDYIYFDSIDAKRKFPGFKLAEKLQGVALPDSEAISDGVIGSLPGLVFGLIMDLGDEAEFIHEIDPDEGTIVDTIYGSLSGLAPMLGGIVDGIIPGVGAKLAEVLAQVNLSLTATINAAGTIDYVDLGITTDSKEILLTFESKLEPDFNPFEVNSFKIPANNDLRYVETNILNFVLNGNFTFNGVDKAIADYGYELKVDINPFELLEKAVVKDAKGALAFDVTKLLDITSGGLYFNVYHDCAVNGCADKHLTAGNGSVFAVAYSPRDFGNTNLYMSFDLQSIVPAGLLDVALKAETKEALVKTVNAFLPKDNQITALNDDALRAIIPAGTQTLTMDTKALMASVGSPVVTADEQVATADMIENYNPLKTVFKAFEFLAGITYSNANGVKIEVAPLVQAVVTAEDIINDSLAKSDNGVIKAIMAIVKAKGDKIDVEAVLNTALLSADTVAIKVTDAAYGVENLNKFNFQKAFDEVKAGVAKPIDRVVSVEPVLNAKGNIQMTTDSGVEMYDAEGNFRPMSDKEWAAVLASKRTVKVLYKTVANTAGVEIEANVITMSGLDTAVVDKAQNVYVVIGPVDGITPKNEHIAAHQFMTKLTVTSLAKEKGSELAPMVAFAENGYAFGADINANYKLTLTYKGGATKTYENIAPTTNAQLVKGGKVNAAKNFKLGYNKFGYTAEATINVTSAQAENVESVNIKAGESFKITGFDVVVGEGTANVKTADMFNEKTVTFKWTKDADRKVFTAKHIKKLPSSYTVVFDEAGEYELVMEVVGGFTKTFKFVVTIPVPEVAQEA